jgi:mono/diheme cytochrome c family protein
MYKRSSIWLISLIFGGLILAACGSTATPSAFFGEQEQFEKPQPPEQFADLSNPLSDDPEMIAEGEVLYQANCSSCHGFTGKGDGTAASGLEPRPENLAQNQSDLSDAYLFWRISEGGLIKPFNSLMPAWKGLMNEEKIWQVVSYLRNL